MWLLCLAIIGACGSDSQPTTGNVGLHRQRVVGAECFSRLGRGTGVRCGV